MDDLNEDEADRPLVRFMAHAGDVVGTAAATWVGAVAGDPLVAVAGAVGASVFSKAAWEFATRDLSRRQVTRASRVTIGALGYVRAKEVLGETIRDDDFFEGEHSDGEEVIEGVLRAAMDEYEERKLDHYSRLLANACFEKDIPAPAIHYALRMGESLSWTELQMLGIFWRAEQGKLRLPDHEKNYSLSDWFDASVHLAYFDLTERHHLIEQPLLPAEGSRLGRYDLTLSGTKLTVGGRLVAGLMELDEIPQTDFTRMLHVLSQPPTEEGAD